MRIGIIGQCNNKGLGNMTWEFYRHLNPVKTMIVTNRFTRHLDRFPDAIVIQTKRPNDNQLERFIENLDIVLTLETPYNTDLFRIAKNRCVKSILIPMFEFLNPKWDKPDLYICSSMLDYDSTIGNKVYLPWPINDKVLKRRRPSEARIFLHNTGGGGLKNRNGCDEMYEAVGLVKNKNVEFIINRQRHLDVDNYWDLWAKGDIFVFPHKFAGLSLPIQEAMATGLPVITTDFYEFNKYIPKELLLKPDFVTEEAISRKIKLYNVKPQTIADKIDEVASWSSKKIGELSDMVYEYSQTITWDKMIPRYIEVFNNLING